MRNYNPANHANVPTPRRSPDDIVGLVDSPTRPASMREAVPFINVPGPGETWQELAEWRSAYGLPPVTR